MSKKADAALERLLTRFQFLKDVLFAVRDTGAFEAGTEQEIAKKILSTVDEIVEKTEV